MMITSFFFFKQKTAYEMRIRDWSSDVCSSDLSDAADTGDAAEAERLTSAANSRGRVPNSRSTSTSLGIGGAFVNDGGSLGVSFGYLDSEYGIPPRADLGEEPTIKLRQYRADVRGEVELGDGFFGKLRLRGAYGDYTHKIGRATT